jgi:mannose-6-phosphate isomerase-like protein (cupin superfamily)
VPIKEWHQISNPFKLKTHIIEIQYGEDCLENDIERLDKN